MLGIHAGAIVEVVLFLTAGLLLDLFVFDGNRFWDVKPHPFWIVVIMTGVRYGTAEGLTAAVASTAALLIGNWPQQSIDQGWYDHLLGIWSRPLMWLSGAVFLGVLRARQVSRTRSLIQEIAERDEKLKKINKSHGQVSRQKEALEELVADPLDTAIELYNTAREVEKMDSVKVMASAMDLTKTILNPAKASIYLLVDDVLQAGMQEGWSEEDKYLNSFRSNSGLFTEVVGRQRFLNTTRPEDERVLAGQGVMAGPLINRNTGEVSGMLKIERIPFLDPDSSTVKSFEILCEWLGALLSNARNYREGRTNPLGESRLMTQRMYQRHVEFLRSLSGRLNFEVSVVRIQLGQPHRLSLKKRRRAATILAEVVNISLRQTDYAFDYLERGWSYEILLPGNNLEGAYFVVDKVKSHFGRRLEEELPDVQFAISAEKLA
ncbi:MAG: GAF domain-containing protein [Acidobacteriota bacterium]|nr:GAF domain-containing protein [Acidobacteriota bacterium]